MTEYIITVALIAIAAIAIITLFGDNVRNLFGMSADALAGATSVQKRTVSTKGASQHRTLATFGMNGGSSGGASNGGATPNARTLP